MASQPRKHHALAIPLPAQGHINALMRFCKQLASQGFTITFVNIEPVHQRIEQLQAAAAAAAEEEEAAPAEEAEGRKEKVGAGGSNIRRAYVPIHGLDLSNDFRFSFEHFFEAMRGLTPQLEQLLLRLSTQEPPVTCLISDFFMTAPSYPLALQFNLPRIVFYPFLASMLLFTDYVVRGHISQDQVLDAIKKGEKGIFCGGLPGLPTINIQDLPIFKHLEDNNEYMYQLSRRELQESIRKGHVMVVNSFKEAEKEAFEVLAEHLKVPVYPVGPLVETLQGAESVTSLWKEDKACMKWLDQQAPLSVLYVSFGSITFISLLQFEELVVGLLSSKYAFLFVFRPDLLEQNPHGSISSSLQLLHSSAKGYVVEWTPQSSILSHPSVGGFLTHCGLNSTMEALAHSVPMLCWPYFVDQFMNAKFIVEEWKVGLYFWANNETHGSIITREAVEKRIKVLMEGEDGQVVRKNVERFRELGHQSLSSGGTSFKNLQDLIQSL